MMFILVRIDPQTVDEQMIRRFNRAPGEFSGDIFNKSRGSLFLTGIKQPDFQTLIEAVCC